MRDSPPDSPSLKARRPASLVVETLSAKTSETKEGLQQINQYVLKREIGRGAFGTVHLGMDINTGIEYAIKEFSKQRLRRREQSAMLRRPGPRGRGAKMLGSRGGPGPQTSLDLIRTELAILKKLNHPHVVSLYEVLDDPENDSLYMVFEMAHKGVLMNVEADTVAKSYSNDDARHFFRQMILGIEYLHYSNVVHRDIKPDNLLLSKDGVLKIVDFGVSEMFDKESDRLKKSAGSPAFMAPELCKTGHGDISGKAADIWSMGVTLYCLVYGHLPFISASFVELNSKICNDPVEYADGLDPDLLALLKRLLEKDPSRRITIPELREDSWVTNHGKDPLISKEENCAAAVTDVTEEEINRAISRIAPVFMVMKAVSKFKRHSRSLSQQSLSKIMDKPLLTPESKSSDSDDVERLKASAESLHISSPK
ncbi:kinase-like domain-containing protein [Dichotomocladium elegans]|nr:kinase-like domain-containing protein [Dichotomocladium elegans]